MLPFCLFDHRRTQIASQDLSHSITLDIGDKDSSACSNVEHAIGWLEVSERHDPLEPRNDFLRRRLTKTTNLIAKERSLVPVMCLPIVHILRG